MLSTKQCLDILNRHRDPGTPEYSADDARHLRRFGYRLARAIVRGDVTAPKAKLQLHRCNEQLEHQ